jgi:hypothetical protein
MQTLRIGSVEFESPDPMVTKVLSRLKELGIDISNPANISIAADKFARQANECYRKGDKEGAEQLAHISQSAMQAALTIKKVDPKLLKEPTNVLIDTGATKMQTAVEAPRTTINIPAPAELKLPPGPGSETNTTVVPSTAQVEAAKAADLPAAKAADIQVGISTGTVVGVGAAAFGAWLLWKRLRKA